MSGFAGYLNRTHTPSDDKAHAVRYRVVRHDGVVLGGSSSREVAERLARVVCAGRRADYAMVMTYVTRREATP